MIEIEERKYTEEEFKKEAVAILKKHHLMFDAYIIGDDILRFYLDAKKPTILPTSLMELMFSLYKSTNRQIEELVQTVVRVNSYIALANWGKKIKKK